MNLSKRVNDMAESLESLIQKAELWQLIFDECPLALAVFTSDMKFFLVNQAFLELTGFDQEELIDRKISVVIPMRFRKMHREAEKQYALKPEKKVNRHGLNPEIITKSGLQPVDIDLSYIVYDGKVYYTAFLKKLDKVI